MEKTKISIKSFAKGVLPTMICYTKFEGEKIELSFSFRLTKFYTFLGIFYIYPLHNKIVILGKFKLFQSVCKFIFIY